MSQEDTTEFSRAVSLVRTGQKADAHAIFKTLAAKYPTDTSALLWFAFTAPALDEAKAAIAKAVELAPDKPDVQKAQAWLQAETAKTPPPQEDFNIRLNRAIALAQAGSKTQAYQDLKGLAKESGAKDSNLLLWLAFTSPDLEEAETAINMAEGQDFANPNIDAARQWLRKEKQKAFAATVSEFKGQATPFNLRQVPNPASAQPPHNFAGPFNPDFPTNRPEAAFNPAAPRVTRKSRLNLVTILSGALGVMVVALVVLGILYFTSKNTDQSIFEQAGLATFPGLQKLELSQKSKDQLAALYANPELAKNNIKFTKLEFYKLSSGNSATDFNNFLKADFLKKGWMVQSLPGQISGFQAIIYGAKDNRYIMMMAGTANNADPEIRAQLAPNQPIALVLLMENAPQT